MPTMTSSTPVARTSGHNLVRPGPAEDGRARILDAAAKVFADRGYLATTIDAIADELSATKGIVYHYYRGKAEVFLDVVVSGMRELLTQLAPIVADTSLSATDRLGQMVHHHATQMMVRNYGQRVSLHALEMRSVPEIAKHVEVLEEVFELRRQYEQLFVDAVEAGIASGEFRTIDSRVAVKAALGSLNWIPIWFTPERSSAADIEDVANTFARFVVGGMKGG
jgi:AcrR family transcriptional regulator